MSYAKYAKVFVIVTAACWVVLFLFFALLLGSLRNAVGASFAVAAVFGAILAGLVWFLDRKRMDEGLEVDNFEVKTAEGTLELSRSVPETLALCKLSLDLFPGAKVERQGENFLVARVGPSTKSLGETLEFAAEPNGNKGTLLGIHSKPRFAWTMVDFGKNAENVKRLTRDIEKRAAAAKARGFTLIEVLAVVMIAGLILAAAAVNLFPGDAEVARREAGMLTLAIEGARDDAWFGGRPVAVSVDESRLHTWRLRPDRTWEEDSGKGQTLREGLKVVSLHVDGERLPANERLVFLPDGLGVPFRLAVEVRGIGRAIEGDAAGAVRLVEAK